MKLKKIIAGIMTTVMITGVSAVLAEKVETPEENLMRYGIIEGDADGDLRLEDNITRAEFAKIVCIIKGMSAEESESADTVFPDVSIDHWASGYINIVQGLGIINGYEDGTFRPEENITNAEAVKMLVVALGYEPFAADNGGYPNGYMMAASRFGVLENVTLVFDKPATRKDAFTLVYNSLGTPIMEQTTYGPDPEYVIMNGENGIPLVTLRTLSGFEENE